MQMKNKIKHKILYLFRRLLNHLATWLHNGPVVIDARPIHQDTHLNSAEAIGHWLAVIDRLNEKRAAQWLRAIDEACTHLNSRPYSDITPSSTQAGGGASDEESE